MPLDQGPPRDGPPPFGRPATPAEILQLLYRNVEGHIGKLGGTVARCLSVQIFSTVVRTHPPAELPAWAAQDPAALALVRGMGRHAAGFCHVFGPEHAAEAKAFLLAAIEQGFTDSAAEVAPLVSMMAEIRAGMAAAREPKDPPS